MSKQKESVFQFAGYRVLSSSYHRDFNNDPPADEMNVEINPEAEIDYGDSTIRILLDVEANDENDCIFLSGSIVGYFNFENVEKRHREDLMFVNAPAILFPHIRAYFSTLSALSGNETVILPALDLRDFKEKIKNNLTVINDNNEG